MPDLSTTWTRRRHIKSDQPPSSDIYWQHYTLSLMILPEAAVPTSSPTVHRTPRPNHVPGPRVGVLRGSAATVLRGSAATVLCGALGLALGATAARTTASSTGPIGLDVLVAALALGLGAAAAVVLAVGCGLLTVAALGRALGRSLDGLDALAARLTPALLRRAVAVTVSTGLGLAAATGVASASEPDLGWQVTTSSSASGTDAAPGGAAGPGRPEPSAEVRPGPAGAAVAPQTVATEQDVVEQVATAAAPQPAATVAIPPTRPPASTVTVLAGDSLWRIAAAHLPVGSSDADVASAWPLWYAANRDVVGPDPGLIHPGQVLTAPAAEESA